MCVCGDTVLSKTRARTRLQLVLVVEEEEEEEGREEKISQDSSRFIGKYTAIV